MSLAAQCSAQAMQTTFDLDPRRCMKMSYKNFQETDNERHGVLDAEHFLQFCRKEHASMCEMMGLDLPFDERVYVEGFACQQFEGKGGVTFTDLQIGAHMANRILKERMV